MHSQWHVLFNWPTLLVLFGAAVLVALVYLYYRRSLPPLSAGRRTVLRSLRALALLIVFFLLMNPVLEVVRQEQLPPRVALLLDNSASMSIQDRQGRRADSLVFLWKQIQARTQGDSLRWSVFAFDTGVSVLENDTLSFSVDGTNISRALLAVQDSLLDQNLQAIVLLSDGIFNQGVDPLSLSEKMAVPVYTVLIGDPSPPRDLQIVRVETNPVSYVGDELPVEVVVRQHGYAGQKVVVEARLGDRVVARRAEVLGQNGLEQRIALTWKPSREGEHRLRISVSALEGEVTALNNRQEVQVTVLKRKQRILVVSGSVDYDRQMLGFLAGQLPDFQFLFRTEAGMGKYFEGSLQRLPLDSLDLLMFHGFPTSRSSANQIKRLLEQVGQKKLPVVWLLNRRTDLRKLIPYQENLPFKASGRLTSAGKQTVQLSELAETHPLIDLADDPRRSVELWQGLPPIEVFRGVEPAQGSQILTISKAARRSAADVPVFYVYRFKGRKQVVFAGAGWGFWHFQLQDDAQRDRFFVRFLERLVRWSVNRETVQQVQIKPVRRTVNLGEAVEFSGTVYDALYRPLADAQVSVQLSGPEGFTREDQLSPTSNGRYRLSVSGLPEGEYRYTVTARKEGRVIGRRRGRVTVRPFYLEFQKIPARPHLLQALARRTGGRFFAVANFLQHFPDRPFMKRTHFATWERPVGRSSLWLIALIVLLALEWYLRKRWHLL